MSYFEFPHTRSYDGDLGFIIKRLEELNTAYNNFFDYNTIKFHDPIEWIITETYIPNTIVYDVQSETFYIAKQAVPAGIDISNTDFWILLTPFKTDTALDSTSINPIANKPVTLRFNAIAGDIADLNARLRAEITNRTEGDAALSARVNTNAANINSEAVSRLAADNLINTRIDEIISGGSVDPDAELVDIRTTYDGVTYSNAGDAVRAQAENNNSDIIDKCDNYINLFNPLYIVTTAGGKQDGNEFICTPFNLSNNYPAGTSYPLPTLESGVYTLSFDAYTEGNQGTSGNGLRVLINYDDSTDDRVTITNDVNTFRHYTLTSNPAKTVTGISFGYGSNGNNIWHLKNIMFEKAYSASSYVPFNIPKDNKARDAITAINGEISNIKNDIKKIDVTLNQVETPAAFSWADHPLKDKIYSDYNGNYYVDFDISDYDPASTGTTYYVDPVNGAEDNSGLTPYEAVRKMSTAYNKAGCSCIMLADGVYNQGTNLNQITITKNLAIKAMPGAKPVITTDSGSTFTVYSGNTYSASRGSCARVLDMSRIVGDNEFYEYINKDTVDEVIATAGSWAHISGVLYVHCFDNREPDADLLLLVASNNIYAVGNPIIYLENLTIISGYSPVRVVNTESNTNPKVFGKNCKFLYSETVNNDVVMLEGTALSIFENCIAKYGMKDGFNYHAKNNTTPRAIEINCVGAYCGNADDSNDQGSTIHDGGTIIRIHGCYHDNYGSNIADESAESWNFMCSCYKPLAPNSGQRANFYAYSGTTLFIDTCRLFGNAHYNIISATDDTTNVYLRNNIFDNGTKDTFIYGVVPEYY